MTIIALGKTKTYTTVANAEKNIGHEQLTHIR